MTRALAPAAVLLLAFLFTITWPTAAHAEDGPDASTAPAPISSAPDGNVAPDTVGGPGGFLPDPRQWAADVFNQVLINLLRGISGAVHAVVGTVLGSSLNFITQTPPSGSYASPTVQALWSIVRAISSAALMLVALWTGFNLMVRQQTGAPYHEAMEVFPRLVVGALLASTSLSWAQLAIDANNGLCQAIGQIALPSWDQADSASQLLVDVLAILIYLVASLLLLLQMLMRLALVDVLLVVSPLGLLCWILPQTQGWARLWSSTFFSAVFTQFVQVLALRLGGALATELTPMAGDSALLAVLLGLAVIVLTLKIPDLMRSHLDSGLGFVRYAVYRQGAQALEGKTGRSGRGD